MRISIVRNQKSRPSRLFDKTCSPSETQKTSCSIKKYMETIQRDSSIFRYTFVLKSDSFSASLMLK